MTTKTEAIHPGEFLLSEMDLYGSRDTVTVASGQGKLNAGTVLGKTLVVTTAPGTAFAGTGNGAITMDASTPVLAGAIAGAYTATMVTVVANGGVWSVVDPNGQSIGNAYTAQTFANKLKFVIADGATDFVLGDKFTITVAAGDLKYRLSPADGSTAKDGTSTAAAVIWEAVDATSADISVAAIARNAEVDGGMLTYATTSVTGLTNTQLGALGVIVR
jgi:hypothetical protein